MIPEEAAAGERLDSWKSIAAYLGRDIRTAIRWEKERGLPVHRIPGGQRQGVYAFRDELDDWLAGTSNTPKPGPDGVDEPPETSTATALPPPAEVAVEQHQPIKSPTTHWKRTIYAAAGLLAVLLLSAAAYKYARARFAFRIPQLIGQQQLTANGQEKYGLLTDGRSLYFGQEQDGWFALAEMPVEGGEVRVLWSPQANVVPLDISPDGKRMLALTSLGIERERELWIVPLDGGAPYRPGAIMAHSAAWAPDSRTFAYAASEKINLLRDDGAGQRELASFAALPDQLHWSNDGERLYFFLEEISSQRVSHWELDSEDGMKTSSLRTLPASLEGYPFWTRAHGSDAFFLASSPNWKPRLWLMQHGRHWWEPTLQLGELPLGQGQVLGVASPSISSRIFLLKDPPFRTTLARFDLREREFRQILPGVSGEFLDYSRDGSWVAYTTPADNSLWISRADGSEPRQITSPPEAAELPRWSPDGKELAFSSRAPDRPWRIFIVRIDSGERREASEGIDNQGAPTWSPDGKFIAYGGLKCQESNSCAIHRIDLSTGKVQTLPGSDGLFTARWSPDGRQIAALHLERHLIFLFDLKTQKWRKLADAVDGTDMSWSPDSRYVYIDIPGADARIVRFNIADGREETVLDLRAQDKFNLAKDEDLRFSLAADGSVILPRRIHAPEVYAYDLSDR
jgi:Tol biopolymer transport system component